MLRPSLQQSNDRTLRGWRAVSTAVVPKYDVEEMDATPANIVNANTPLRAAREATDREVTLRTSEPVWIRVTDEKPATFLSIVSVYDKAIRLCPSHPRPSCPPWRRG